VGGGEPPFCYLTEGEEEHDLGETKTDGQNKRKVRRDAFETQESHYHVAIQNLAKEQRAKLRETGSLSKGVANPAKRSRGGTCTVQGKGMREGGGQSLWMRSQ